MGTRAFAVLVAVILGSALGACRSELLPGRCDKDSDCPSKMCNLGTGPEGYGRCVPTSDGGSGDADAAGLDAGDAGDAGDARDAFSCEVLNCGGMKPVCDETSQSCRACAATSTECALISATAPVCAATGACVECGVSTDCKVATTPICRGATNSCGACTMNDECVARDKATPGCAGSGKCVECTVSSHCGTATKPVCDMTLNTCKGCTTAGNECATISPTKPACSTTGACVECVANADCEDPTKPICDKTSNTCQRCKADTECTTGPKVCMNHQDGRCATDAETIYVQAIATCASMVGAANGTASVPYCTMDPGIATLGTTSSKKLIVVRGDVSNGSPLAIPDRAISVVGQMSAGIAGAIRVTAGDVYLRRLTISAGKLLVGCQAEKGSTLHLDHVEVTGNRGGIYLNEAAFEIQNTIVADNEFLSSGGTTWAGIYVSNPPAAGPKKLQFISVQNNKGPGVVCSSAAQGSGVLASGNTLTDVTTAECGFSPCGAASATCGAQP